MAPIQLRRESSTNGTASTHDSIEGTIQKTNQAPSDNDFESTNTVGPVGPPLSQVDVPVNDDKFKDSKEVPKSTIKDGGTGEYWDTVSTFASDITNAARNALLNRRAYFRRVVAVIAYWETATRLGHLRKQADKMCEVFKERFKFDAIVYRIPDRVTERKFVSTIGNELDKVAEDRDSLFILYYGGHASMVEPTNGRLWKKENSRMSPEIEWSSAIRSLFKTRAVCSKLFIFDCCHAGGMIDATLPWDTSCELLGACGPDVEASALKVSSFTAAFLEEVSNNTYGIWELHAALCHSDNRAKYNLDKYPHYQDFMGHQSQSYSALIKKVGSPSESESRPLKPSDMLARLQTISDAVICIAVTFKCNAEAFMEELEGVKKNWRRWFKFAPTECDDIIVKACHGAELVAVFNSNSCITIWTFPIWLWDAMAPVGGYQHIGIIRPQNFALTASRTQIDLAVPDCPSTTTVGDVHFSPAAKSTKLPPFQDTILEGRTGEGDPHLGSIKPPSATSTETKPKSKLPTKNLPEQPVQRGNDKPGRWRHRYLLSNSHKKEQESSSRPMSNAPLSSSSPFPHQSRISTFDDFATLYLSRIPPSLVDLIHDPSEKKKASRIQSVKTPRKASNILAGLQYWEHARGKYITV